MRLSQQTIAVESMKAGDEKTARMNGLLRSNLVYNTPEVNKNLMPFYTISTIYVLRKRRSG